MTSDLSVKGKTTFVQDRAPASFFSTYSTYLYTDACMCVCIYGWLPSWTRGRLVWSISSSAITVPGLSLPHDASEDPEKHKTHFLNSVCVKSDHPECALIKDWWQEMWDNNSKTILKKRNWVSWALVCENMNYLPHKHAVSIKKHCFIAYLLAAECPHRLHCFKWVSVCVHTGCSTSPKHQSSG